MIIHIKLYLVQNDLQREHISDVIFDLSPDGNHLTFKSGVADIKEEVGPGLTWSGVCQDNKESLTAFPWRLWQFQRKEIPLKAQDVRLLLDIAVSFSDKGFITSIICVGDSLNISLLFIHYPDVVNSSMGNVIILWQLPKPILIHAQSCDKISIKSATKAWVGRKIAIYFVNWITYKVRP